MPSASTGSCGLQRESARLSHFWWARNVAITAVPVVCGLGSAPRTSSNTLPIMCSLGRRFRRAVGCLLFSCVAADKSRVCWWCERRQFLQRSSGFLAQVYPKFTPSARSSQTSASSWNGFRGVSHLFSCFLAPLGLPPPSRLLSRFPQLHFNIPVALIPRFFARATPHLPSGSPTLAAPRLPHFSTLAAPPHSSLLNLFWPSSPLLLRSHCSSSRLSQLC